MVSTIAALLFVSAISLAFWAIAHTLYIHAGQIADLVYAPKSAGPLCTAPLPATGRRGSDIRRPVSVTPLRRSSLRAAA